MKVFLTVLALTAAAYGAEISGWKLNETPTKEGNLVAERHAAPYLDPCRSECTVNLTQWWRKDDKGLDHQPGGNYNCDEHLQNNEIWFRVKGGAGNRIRSTCPPSYSCGGLGGFWTNAALPTQIGQLTKVPIYGSWDDSCYWYKWPVSKALSVIKCSPVDGDFVYKLHGQEACAWSICTMD